MATLKRKLPMLDGNKPKEEEKKVETPGVVVPQRYTQAQRGGGVASRGVSWDTEISKQPTTPSTNTWDSNTKSNLEDQPMIIGSELERDLPSNRSGDQGGSNQQEDQAKEALKGSVDGIVENARNSENELRNQLQWGAVQRDRQKDDLQINTENSQRSLDRQLDGLKLRTDRAIEDTRRNSERNLSILEKASALSGINRSSGFSSGLNNIKEDTIRTINRLQQDYETAKNYAGEDSTSIWENYEKQKNRIDENFEYQYREFTNWATASLAELTSAGFDPDKMNDAIDKIYEEAEFKTFELYNSYIDAQGQLNAETRAQQDQNHLEQSRKNEQSQQFISQYIGYNGEYLQGQTLSDLQGYYDQGLIDETSLQFYSDMMKSNSIQTLSSLGQMTQEDITIMSSLLDKGYTPQEAITQITTDNQDRYNSLPQWSPEVEKIGENRYGYFDEDNNFIYFDQGSSAGNSVPGEVQQSGGSLVVQNSPQSVVDFSIQNRGRSNLQCGELVNDYWTMVTGSRAGIGDTYISKVKAVENAGLSSDPVVGGMVVSNPLNNGTGHVGIVQSLNQDGSINVLEANAEGSANGGVPTTKTYNNASGLIFSQAPGSSSEYDGPVGGSGVPIAYERRIKNMVPATLMNSEIELKQLNDTIRSLHDGGVSPEEAVLTYLGFEVAEGSNKDLAMGLVSIAKGLNDPTQAFYSNLSDFINNGQEKRAVMKLEREAINQAQKDNPNLVFSDAGTSFTVKQALNIKGMMVQYEQQFGPVKGSRNNATKGVFGNKKAQKLATAITQAVSKMRNDLIGSNVTEGERKILQDLIPTLDETSDTAKIKVQNLIDTPLKQYNEARSYVGLPVLTVNTLLNRDKRVGLYGGVGAEQNSSTSAPARNTGSGNKSSQQYLDNLLGRQ